MMERKLDIGKVQKLQQAIAEELPCYDVEELTSHLFCDGLYARALFIPKDTVVVGKMHAQENFFFLASGEMSITTDTEVIRIKAPFIAVTKPGSKRVGYAHTDSLTYNFHANPDNETDMKLLEARYIVPAENELEWRPDAAQIEQCLKIAKEEAA